MLIFQITVEREAASGSSRQDSSGARLPKIEFAAKDAEEALSRLSQTFDSATKRDLDILCFFLRNNDYSERCANVLSWLAQNKPELFREEHVGALINGLGNERSAWGCANVLKGLAQNKPELLREEHVSALINGLGNERSAVGCANVLSWLAYNKPEFSERCLKALLSNTQTQGAYDSSKERAEALVSFAIEAGRPLDNLHENQPEREKYLAKLNTITIIAILASNPEYFYTSSNHMLFDRLKKDLKGGNVSELMSGYGISFDAELGRNFLFRAINYDRMYGKRDSLLTKEETNEAAKAILKPISSETFDNRYYFLLANGLEKIVSSGILDEKQTFRISKELVKAVGYGNTQKRLALEFILFELQPQTTLLAQSKKQAIAKLQKMTKYNPKDYVGKDGFTTCIQVFDREDTGKDHWNLSNEWGEWNSSRWKKEILEDGKHAVFTNASKKKRVILYMGENENEDQSFAGKAMEEYGNGIITFRGHSFSLGKSFPSGIFANRQGNWLFIPGSCGSAGSTADYMMQNPKTSLSFVSNTSTGRGQVTNGLVSIFLGLEKKVEFETLKADSSEAIAQHGGNVDTLTFASQGEMLLRYVLMGG